MLLIGNGETEGGREEGRDLKGVGEKRVETEGEADEGGNDEKEKGGDKSETRGGAGRGVVLEGLAGRGPRGWHGGDGDGALTRGLCGAHAGEEEKLVRGRRGMVMCVIGEGGRAGGEEGEGRGGCGQRRERSGGGGEAQGSEGMIGVSTLLLVPGAGRSLGRRWVRLPFDGYASGSQVYKAWTWRTV